MTRIALLAGSALALLPLAATAAGVERNPPSTRVLFEPGRYLEFSFNRVSPELEGEGGLAGGVFPVAPNGTGELLESFTSLGFAYKADLDERLSYALIIDTPYGVDTSYPVVDGSIYSTTAAELDSLQVTGILAYEAAPGISVYGGLRAQKIEAETFFPFLGALAGPLPPGVTGVTYDIEAEADWDTGWLAGVAYERPDIALRVALTYYSEIGNVLDTTETLTAITPLGGIPTVTEGTVEITTPQSVNLEFQTGIMADTLLFGSVRWVDWSDFAVAPTVFTDTVGQPLVDYQEDWTTYTLGVGRRFTDTWSGAVQVSWEPAADYVPLTTLGPIDGRRSFGLAATYEKDGVKITSGVTWVKLGETENFAGTEFDDGDAFGFGVRVGYTF